MSARAERTRCSMVRSHCWRCGGNSSQRVWRVRDRPSLVVYGCGCGCCGNAGWEKEKREDCDGGWGWDPKRDGGWGCGWDGGCVCGGTGGREVRGGRGNMHRLK